MTDKDPHHSHDDNLRRRAESRARDDQPQPDDLEVRSPEETRQLLHELRVHQIELEMQNEELQRAQAELEASRARYLDLYDRAPVGYCILSETGLILEANLTVADLLGTARTALIKQPVSRFIAPHGQDIYYHHLRTLYQTGAPQTCKIPLVRESGGQFWARLDAAIAHDAAGARTARMMITDITERQRADEALRESELRFRQIYDHVHMGIVQISLQFVIEHANPAYCQMLGYTEAELQGKRLGEITHPDTIEENLQKQAQLAWGEMDHYQMEKRFIHKEGHTVYGILNANLIRDAAGKPSYCLGSVLDITQRKKLEQQLNQQAQLAAVGQLAAGIAHDFRNLLTTIVLYTQLSQRNPDLPPQVAHALDTILNESRKATDLVQQILDFSSRAIATLQPLDLEATVDHIATTLQRTLPETIRLTVSRGTANYAIEGDAGRIEQVLMNLALNSRDAMPDGGELRIALSRFQLSPHQKPPVPEMPPGAWICLSVTDTGSGMTKEAYAHLFEPFFTTKEVGQGTGLGLAQVYGIVRLHKGFINVTTHRGEGTTVDIYVPAAGKATKYDREEVLTALLGEEETILLVEDNDKLRESGGSLLEDLGYRVITAANGLEALSAFATADPPVDLLLTDIVMPEMGGKALLEELRRHAPHLRALGMTGYPLQDDLEALLKAGFVEVLIKPFEIGKLAHAIRRALTAS